MLRLPLQRLAVSAALSCACSSPPPRYTTTAEVVEVDPGPPVRLVLNHAAIPGFRDAEGKVVGMQAMKMAFGLDESVDATPIQIGDRVRIVFDMDYERREPLVIQQLSPLPQGSR